MSNLSPQVKNIFPINFYEGRICPRYLSLSYKNEGSTWTGPASAAGMWTAQRRGVSWLPVQGMALHSSERYGGAYRRTGKVLLTISDSEHQLNKQTNTTREKSHTPDVCVRSRFLPGSADLLCPLARSVLWVRLASEGASAPSSEAPGFLLYQSNTPFTPLLGDNRNTAYSSFEGWKA